MQTSFNYPNNQLAVSVVMMNLKMTIDGSKWNQVLLENGNKGMAFQGSFTKARIGEECLLQKTQKIY